MALYMKQDFTPPVLSRRWIAIKFRPNMLLNSHQHILSILESGLMFREDSIEVEQEAPSQDEVWGAAGGTRGGWFTRGEGVMSGLALAACVGLFPPRSRTALLNLSLYATIPIAIRSTHRALSRGRLTLLLKYMRDYLALARRAAACLKEFAALHTQLGSLSSVIDSCRTMLCRQQSELAVVMSRASSALLGNAPWLRSGSLSSVIDSCRTMLCRQQSELAVVMSRASSALLGNAPWLRDDVAWHAVARDDVDAENLMKIHHAFLVVQSTLLKHIAMVHYILSPKLQKIYKNHNERLYWIHNTLITNLLEEFKSNFESLERMYRLLKNAGNKDDSDSKKLGTAVKNNWVYSEVHTGVARACLELKLALNKGNSLDMFLDSCAMNNQEINADILSKDIDDLVENITNCLTTIQASQLRLQKLKGKIVENVHRQEEVVENTAFTIIEDKEPQTKDEVFYFVKTEDDEIPAPQREIAVEPGKKEKEASKIVLNELKRKLGKREDLMRERERQALVKTMPELKNIPEFPRQIKFDEYIVRKGYITKINRNNDKKKLFRHYSIESKSNKNKKKYGLTKKEYVSENDIKDDLFKANSFLNVKSELISLSSINKDIFINLWCKAKPRAQCYSDFSDLSDNASTSNKNINQAVKTHEVTLKFSKKDLELSESSSESDFEYYKTQRALLNDIRRHRVARKKNHPSKARPIDDKPIDNVDESLKPIEYSFGAGLAMASMLQVNNAKFLNLEQEEVFNGDGEVSNDSGNDEDA